jgi:alanine racemase
MAVVKADAYGHGARLVTRTLWDEGVRHFCVARLGEGVELRRQGLGGRLLVLAAPLPDELPAYAAHDLDVTVSSPAVAAAAARLAETGTPLRVHVKVETGMGRLGLDPAVVPAVVRRLQRAPGLTLAGLWTHFATADALNAPGQAFAHRQMDRFDAVRAEVGAAFDSVHVANSGALVTLPSRVQAPEGQRGFVRAGLTLYGLADAPELARDLGVEPVLRLTARVLHLKTVAPGTSISYGRTWTAARPSRIATLGVGYGDGYPRLLSNRGAVGLHGARASLVGAVCMDLCMVDLGPPGSALARATEVGDAAVLLGDGGPSAYEVAQWAETIPYEVVTRLAPRVARVVRGA